MSCPCGGGAYDACCGPLHRGERTAETAVELMRSRYAAFALGLPDYLASTQEQPLDAAAALAWSRSVKWLGLTVHRAEEARVEFSARYLQGDRLCTQREASTFSREGGRWRYLGGEPSHTEQRVERNAPCPCGSGKKFKACCA